MSFLHSISSESYDPNGAFPFSLPFMRSLESPLPLHPKVTFFVGENGTGKSTLLEAIADKWGFSHQSGNRDQLSSFREYHTALAPKLRIARNPGVRPNDGFFLRAESLFNFATEMEELDREPFCAHGWSRYGGKSLHEQSHGESFLAIFLHRFQGHSLFLLDEPEAALSATRQLSFLVRMHDLTHDHCQFLIATHSPLLLAFPDAWIYRFDENGIERSAFEDTDHVRIYRRFLSDPQSYLAQLFAEEE